MDPQFKLEIIAKYSVNDNGYSELQKILSQYKFSIDTLRYAESKLKMRCTHNLNPNMAKLISFYLSEKE